MQYEKMQLNTIIKKNYTMLSCPIALQHITIQINPNTMQYNNMQYNINTNATNNILQCNVIQYNTITI